MSFYGNRFLDKDYIINEQVILEKFNITKEEILKDPKGAINKLKHLTDPKENKTSDVSFILYIIGFVSLLVAAAVSSVMIPAAGLFVASTISGCIMDYLDQKGKHIIMAYSKYTRDAKIIYNTIEKEISKLDKIIKENKNPKVTEIAKKEKHELENIIKSYKTYKSEEQYYKDYGYSVKMIEYAKDDIKDYINSYRNKSYLYNNGVHALGLYYTGITQQEFEKFITKYIKDNGDKVYENELWEYVEERHGDNGKEIVKYLQENKPIVINDNNGGDYLLYIPNKKVFLYWGHENDAGNGMQININDTKTYSEIINEAKVLIDKSYKEYFQADAELGYYRLSEPPKGIERKQF